ncbi:MAG: phosphoglucosamine mutase [Microbacteriaceae bacterium]
MTRLFGTDGVRGLANGHLTAELSLKLAQGAAQVLGASARAAGRRPLAVLAKDPRISSDFLGAAVAAGLAASGVDVLDAGVIPTPATAFLIADIQADFGVMISASHNAAPDNGIKFFATAGLKLEDSVEDQIEKAAFEAPLLPTGADVGRIKRFSDAEDRYLLHLLKSLPNRLNDLHVVLDCANGAASGVSPQIFHNAGAKITVIAADPDGININHGVGSTHLESLQQKVLELGADLGIAHDGDADRCLAVDAEGRVIDGDQIMAILAIALQEKGELRENTLVATVMSNLGLKIAMRENGITMLETGVGDRYVLAKIREGDYSLGGEQSGHIIFSDFATTGDGVLTGLRLMARMAETGKSLSELAAAMTVYPQVLINVPHVDRNGLAKNAAIAAELKRIESELGDTGRVLLRSSGTEPLIRVMVEAKSDEAAHFFAEELAQIVRDELSL